MNELVLGGVLSDRDLKSPNKLFEGVHRIVFDLILDVFGRVDIV